MNFLLRTDSYKFTHWKQYPPKTTGIYSYLESRGGMFPNTVFFGLQYYLKAYFEGPRFTAADIAQTDEFCRQHFSVVPCSIGKAGFGCMPNIAACCRCGSRLCQKAPRFLCKTCSSRSRTPTRNSRG